MNNTTCGQKLFIQIVPDSLISCKTIAEDIIISVKPKN